MAASARGVRTRARRVTRERVELVGRALETVRNGSDYGCEVVVPGGTNRGVVGPVVVVVLVGTVVVDVVVLVEVVLVVVVDCQCSYEIRSA